MPKSFGAVPFARGMLAGEKRRCLLPRVLVVDEQDSQARLVAMGLRVEGFDAETAAGSDAALARLEAQPFDVAILDLMLPGMNGIQLARVVRERHPGTCVVLTSAYHLSERQLARADCGATGFVPKPLDLSELARFLRAKVRGADVAAVHAANLESDAFELGAACDPRGAPAGGVAVSR
jgi:DNA-binding response OmpR family regulator